MMFQRLSGKFKYIVEDLYDFFKDTFIGPFIKKKLHMAANLGKRFALPKKYFKKTLNDKEIANLGVPLKVLKNGNTVFVKSYKYKFENRERFTNVFTNLSPKNSINKVTIQTKGITTDCMERGIPPYGSCLVFDKTGKIKTSNWSYISFQENVHKYKRRIFNINGDDNLKLRFESSHSYCKDAPRMHVQVSSKKGYDFGVEFYGKNISSGTKTYLELRRQELNSPKSMKALSSAVSNKSLSSSPVIRL